MHLLTIPEVLAQRGTIVDLLPPTMADVTKQDAVYHTGSKETWLEQTQMLTPRNLVFHRQVVQAVVRGLSAQAVVLELGAGVGFDADLLLQHAPLLRCYIVSELSAELLHYARTTYPALGRPPVVLCTMDANRLLLANSQVDAVLMVAALHHVPDLYTAVGEIDRVLKTGGRVVFGMEPNITWGRLITRLRSLYRRLFAEKAHSAADEEAEGFALEDFTCIASWRGWTLESITPVWCLTGVVHYGLEGAYRALRLRSRVRLPRGIEYGVLGLDAGLLQVPGMRRLAWHYTVVYRKGSGS